ncbi:hypothetical protein JCM10003_2488 [Bacteroides pyogenes JCM 10003]|nr:hypothetical protein JCM10003_2488 [Bacteroides pyogenes JCM 10003]
MSDTYPLTKTTGFIRGQIPTMFTSKPLSGRTMHAYPPENEFRTISSSLSTPEKA